MNLKIFLPLNIMILIKCYLTKIHLSLFHISACSLNNNFDDLQYLLSCTKNNFDIIGVNETRITKPLSLLNNFNLNNYSYEFTPTETTAGGTLFLHCQSSIIKMS